MATNDFLNGGRQSRPRTGGVQLPAMTAQPMPSSFPSPTAPGSRTSPGRVPGIAPGEPAPGSFPNAGNPPPAPAQMPGMGTGSLEGFGGMRQDGSPKLGSDHALKSPKYAFADVFRNFSNTREGFESGFAELQQKYPQFFSNWRLEGDDSIVWNGQGQLHDAFQGHSGFDVWRNASGEGGGPGGWQWGSHQAEAAANAQTSDPMLNSLLSAFSAPPMQAPAPQGDMSALLSLMASMNQQQTPAPSYTFNVPEPKSYAPPAPQFTGEVPMPLQAAESGGLADALSLIAQRAPMMAAPANVTPIEELIRRLLSGA